MKKMLKDFEKELEDLILYKSYEQQRYNIQLDIEYGNIELEIRGYKRALSLFQEKFKTQLTVEKPLENKENSIDPELEDSMSILIDYCHENKLDHYLMIQDKKGNYRHACNIHAQEDKYKSMLLHTYQANFDPESIITLPIPSKDLH